MKSVLMSALIAVLVVPAAMAQSVSDQPLPEGAAGDLVFPSELLLLPQDVQDAAQASSEPEDIAIPDGLNAADEAYYRAQLAWVTQDWQLARNYAETAAIGGHPQGAIIAGLIANEGLATGEPDPVAAAGWFQRAADQDQPIAYYELGRIAALDLDALNLGPARGWYERAARAGHMDGMVALAKDLRESPVPQDRARAREWAERAALQGVPEAAFQMAQLLDDGIGGETDKPGARLWYGRAADTGHPEAAFQIALMWADGEGGPADDFAARELLRASAETGYAPAQGQYGLMMYQGRGGAPDPAMAAYWFREGARGGDAESQYLYAYALALGDGVDQDLEAAYAWVVQAGTDVFGEPVINPDRDTLEAALERALPPSTRAEILAQINAGLEP